MNNNEDNIETKNKEHIQNTYKDKTIKILSITIGVAIISLCTYVMAIFLYKAYDFGFIFEIISFIFIVMALFSVKENKRESAKKNIIIAMIPYGWLVIYDFINLIANIKEVMREVSHYYLSFDKYFYYIEPYLYDVFLVALLFLLYIALKSLKKSEGNLKSNDYLEKFYDEL